jgi:hypothetical protein
VPTRRNKDKRVEELPERFAEIRMPIRGDSLIPTQFGQPKIGRNCISEHIMLPDAEIMSQR